MGQTLYLDCSSGISGDMTVAALLDLGASRERLEAALASLPVRGFEVVVTRVSKHGLTACDFDVRLDAEHENHDHDMAWLFGHEHEGHGGHGHSHEHAHHEHRGLADVLAIVGSADLTDRARFIAVRVFEILADAEAQAHGTTRDQVHFHEVGALDSIVDVVSAAVCLDDLDVERVVAPELSEGCGTVRCAHGVIPVPVPAVCAVASTYGLPLHPTGVRGELVTPTGAAIVAAVRTDAELPTRYTVKRVGLGAGKRSYEGCSGVLRAMLVEPVERASDPEAVSAAVSAATDTTADTVWKLECDIDDTTGEALGHAIETLMGAGAREAHCLPLVTKKGRPAWQLQVICDEERRRVLEDLIFEETTTIGIRRVAMERTVLPRRACTVQTEVGLVGIKEVTLPSGRRRLYPEDAEVMQAARAAGVPYQDAWRAVLAGCARFSD